MEQWPVSVMYYRDKAFALHRLPKLTLDYVVLASFSKMKVKLAIQALNRTVSTCLLECNYPIIVGTAIFCLIVNDFFDCTNVRSTSEHETKRNEKIKPCTSPEHERLIWMKDTFPKFLKDRKQNIQGRDRPGGE